MSKTLKYEPRSASPQYLVIWGEWISIGKGLKLIWQLTVFIGIHIRWLSYGTVTSINTIVVRYATCVVWIKIHPWVVTALLAHLSRRLRGELLVYQWLRRPSSVRPSVNIFKHLLLWNHRANWTQISYGDSLGWGNESLFKCSWSHDQMAAMPIYGKNPLQIFFSRTLRPMTLRLGM